MITLVDLFVGEILQASFLLSLVLFLLIKLRVIFDEYPTKLKVLDENCSPSEDTLTNESV